MLAALWGEETPVGTQERLAFARRHHIALWDVLQRLFHRGADDGSIRQPEINDLRRVLERADIRAIFTTGAKAAALYKRYCLPVTAGRPSRCPPQARPTAASRWTV